MITLSFINFFAQTKSEAELRINTFLNLVFSQYQTNVKIICSYKGKELCITNLYNEKKILHQLTCVKWPQQNSIMEKKHQHLLNITHTLYFQAQTPPKL